MTGIIGQALQLQARFVFEKRFLTDEQLGVITIKLRKPDTTIVTISSGIVKEGTVYKYLLSTVGFAAGAYTYYWQTDGQYACIAEGSFSLREPVL